MAVSREYREFVIEQLERVTRVAAKSMFGGVGLYADGLFFALIDDDTLYFKVDDTNRGDFESAGMGPFMPFKDDSHVMQYYEVPADVLEDAATLAEWVAKAVSVARSRRAARKPAKTKSPSPKKASATAKAKEKAASGAATKKAARKKRVR
ncbi:MAG: TfoX/Sxy family protein [bacterium]